jgi:hypothetical protein
MVWGTSRHELTNTTTSGQTNADALRDAPPFTEGTTAGDTAVWIVGESYGGRCQRKVRRSWYEWRVFRPEHPDRTGRSASRRQTSQVDGKRYALQWIR